MKWYKRNRGLARLQIGKRSSRRVNKDMRCRTTQGGGYARDGLAGGVLKCNDQVSTLVWIKLSVGIGILQLHTFQECLRGSRQRWIRHDDPESGIAVESGLPDGQGCAGQ